MEKQYCQYGRNCFRRHGEHLRNYRHEHLDKILNETTPENIATYNFPSDLLTMKDVIIEQIKVLRNVNAETTHPQNQTVTSATAQQMSNDADAANIVDIKPDIHAIQIDNFGASTSTAAASRPFVVKEEKLHNEVMVKQEPTEPFRPMKIKVEHPKPELPLNPCCINEKLVAAYPYNYFLTAIESSPQTELEPLTISFREILDHSLGDLKRSVQINCLVEPEWLLEQYLMAGQIEKPLLILTNNFTNPVNEIAFPQITTHTIQLGFGTHHTKMMLFEYTDGSMRVIVSTANLYEDDWRNHTQGLWISNRLPASNSSMGSDSPTGFRDELITYLSAYNISDLQSWISAMRFIDFSSVNVFLVTSVPGMHPAESHGLSRASFLLSQHSVPIPNDVDIVAQCSTMGNLNHWLHNDFIPSFQCHSQHNGRGPAPNFKLIYPSLKNVRNSYDGMMGGGCLIYSNKIHQNQLWLKNYLYQWRAEQRYRTRAMPHSKTYARFADGKLFWYILTSANLSKSAWGSFYARNRDRIRISNYEVGVVFFPRFVTNTDYFSLNSSDRSTPVFPLPHDLPLKKYDRGDVPYVPELMLQSFAQRFY